MPHNPVFHRLIATGAPMSSGVCGAQEASIAAIIKPDKSYVIPNELICGAIAQFLRIPIPAFGLIRGAVRGNPVLFASVNFNSAGGELPHCNVSELGKALPSISAGILLFDAFVANTDRHSGNLYFDSRTTSAVIFDHSHALFGPKYGDGIQRFTKLKDEACLNFDLSTEPTANRHCLIDQILHWADLSPWFEKIKATPDWFIEDVIQSAYKISETEKKAAVDFLLYRKDNLERIIRGHKDKFPNLTHSPLL